MPSITKVKSKFVNPRIIDLNFSGFVNIPLFLNQSTATHNSPCKRWYNSSWFLPIVNFGGSLLSELHVLTERVTTWIFTGTLRRPNTHLCQQHSLLSTLLENSGEIFPFSRLENEISWIITEVCHFFSRLDCPAVQFQLFWALFELFFVNIEHFLMNSSMLLLIILLVFVIFGSSQIWW